ncbi:MAG TPA: nicotinate-nucleotide adenylyltransferase [Ferrovibrio sp.]|jgi:nicotinate-nucleotide adenylyltransferase|uniref:nicotinate-nucleotide adenylyltransferase n=1 Tax=Ferrovibrio sp. TaxID=1917215 RepID=UPI002B4B4A32|nr:nicotinate-nucleotide adenylyltransferase [Ferrovibrio sp.]HLT75922.1 nicotinate-nucleotide adenylyltransferase [Ferrovibrio sp.]
MIPAFGSRLSLRIGLLGGSFNPAHAAHREISLTALHRLKLDCVWWLVSPQNPLKDTDGMAPLAQRLRGAEAVASHPRIRVTAVESRLGTRYTADTLQQLRRHYPNMRFVWLMGADNLNQIRHWESWQQIARSMPICVLDRPGHNLTAPQSLAGRWLAQYRRKPSEAAALADAKPPAFLLLKSKLNPLSATAIRQGRKTR